MNEKEYKTSRHCLKKTVEMISTTFTRILCILIFERSPYSLHYDIFHFFNMPTTLTGLEQYESKLYTFLPTILSNTHLQFTELSQKELYHISVATGLLKYTIFHIHISIIQRNCHAWFKISSISIFYLIISIYIRAVSVIFLILVFSCVTHKRGQAVQSHRRDRQATPTPIPQPSSQDLTVGRKWITELPGYSLATT